MKIDEIIKSMDGPIVEIGGPTLRGYDFMKDATIELKQEPIITNISKVVIDSPFSDNPTEYIVDEVVDVRDMPYEDNSIGVFISCALPIYDNANMEEFNSEEERSEYSAERRNIAMKEYENFGNTYSYTTNLRIALLLNSARVLKPGGFVVMESVRPQDIDVASQIGYAVVYDDNNNHIAIFRKDFDYKTLDISQ